MRPSPPHSSPVLSPASTPTRPASHPALHIAPRAHPAPPCLSSCPFLPAPQVFNALNTLELKSLEEPRYLLEQFGRHPLACLTLASFVATNTGDVARRCIRVGAAGAGERAGVGARGCGTGLGGGWAGGSGLAGCWWGAGRAARWR